MFILGQARKQSDLYSSNACTSSPNLFNTLYHVSNSSVQQTRGPWFLDFSTTSARCHIIITTPSWYPYIHHHCSMFKFSLSGPTARCLGNCRGKVHNFGIHYPLLSHVHPETKMIWTVNRALKPHSILLERKSSAFHFRMAEKTMAKNWLSHVSQSPILFGFSEEYRARKYLCIRCSCLYFHFKTA